MECLNLSLINRGEWELKEDLSILEFVHNHGSKWSILAKKLENRTEHSVKNRFFCLLSRNTSIPVVQIKQEKNYLDEDILVEMIKELKERMEREKKKKTEEKKEKEYSNCLPRSNNLDNIFDYETFIAMGNGLEDNFVVFNY